MLGKLKKYVPSFTQVVAVGITMVILLGSGIMTKAVGFWNKHIKLSI